MENRLTLGILPQPDDTTCGPTCLHAVYRYFGDSISLETVIRETGRLPEGGTLAVFLGVHALRRGFSATLYTYNLQVFDPTWFQGAEVDLRAKLRAQKQAKRSAKLRAACDAYVEFLSAGGRIKMEVLNTELIRKHLKRGFPILTGLSATFLYGEPRERWPEEDLPGAVGVPDDVRGTPQGHFVVVCGHDPDTRRVLVADPLWPNVMANDHVYPVAVDRLTNAILLGIVTYDANLLIIRPPLESDALACKEQRADADRV